VSWRGVSLNWWNRGNDNCGRIVDGKEMKTIREHLNERIRRSHNGMLAGFALILVGIYVTAFFRSPWAVIVPGIGFILVVASGLFRTFAIRCPNCRNPVGAFSRNPLGGSRGISQKVKVCPFCVVELDTEMASKSGQPPIPE